jgi:hypothetical protein
MLAGNRERIQEKTMSKTISCFTFSCLILCAFVAGAQRQAVTPQVEVPILPKARAMSPAPPDTARQKSQKNTIGEGMATVTTAEPSSYWVEENVMAEHTKVVTAFLYDAKAGILYAYRNGDFACNTNKNMSGHVLEALYTTGNQAGQPAGSGWFVAELGAGDCGAREPGIYGCRFNAEGQHTGCGVATMNSQTGEIDFAVVR